MYAYNVYDPWESFNNHISGIQSCMKNMTEKEKNDAIRAIRRVFLGEDNWTPEERALFARLEAAMLPPRKP